MITVNDIPKKPEPKPVDADNFNTTVNVDGIPVNVRIAPYYANAFVEIPSINPEIPPVRLEITIFSFHDHPREVAVNELNQSITRVAEAAKLLGAQPKVEAA